MLTRGCIAEPRWYTLRTESSDSAQTALEADSRMAGSDLAQAYCRFPVPEAVSRSFDNLCSLWCLWPFYDGLRSWLAERNFASLESACLGVLPAPLSISGASYDALETIRRAPSFLLQSCSSPGT